MDPMLGLIALRALRSQEEIRQSIERQGASRGDTWQGWLARPRQIDSVHESLFNKNTNYYLYPIELGREQEDILLQQTRLQIAEGLPSSLPDSRSYLVAAAQLGCPSCGCELNFGLYRRCGQCQARLTYVLQCGKCSHLHVGVDVRLFAENMKCTGCGLQLRKVIDPNAKEAKTNCSVCGVEILARTAAANSGRCAPCARKPM
jgi:hypothetical protein